MRKYVGAEVLKYAVWGYELECVTVNYIVNDSLDKLNGRAGAREEASYSSLKAQDSDGVKWVASRQLFGTELKHRERSYKVAMPLKYELPKLVFVLWWEQVFPNELAYVS